MPALSRSILTPVALGRLVLGWGAFVAVLVAGPLLGPPVPSPLLIVALIFATYGITVFS